ncbi:MAG: B-box zinc finger protein [Candidatus Aureabacteria bacterium]|nr:B-box zinc finger protein [Candidatus Auribacterota bacterium]
MSKITCKNHPEKEAVKVCVSCQSNLCEECINIQSISKDVTIESCKECGGRCKDIEGEVEGKKEGVSKISFFSLLPSAFTYPFNGSGKLLLVIGVVFFGLMDLLGSLPFGWVFGIFGSGYLIAYMFKIVNSSAIGKNEMPDWPDVSDFGSDIIGPLWAMFLTTVVSFGPAVICLILISKNPVFLIAAIAFGVLGIIYYPMAIIATALDTNLFVRPDVILVSIFKVIGPYIVACLLLAAIIVGNKLLGAVLIKISPIVGFITAYSLAFYFIIVEMRILGLIYYTNSERLGWFE